MIPIDEQAWIYEQHADAAIDAVIRRIEENREVIKRRQIMRMSTVGVDEYGDASWFKTDEVLGMESLDELCDASFYEVIPIARDCGDSPPLPDAQ